jgi:hypothetical protein
MKQIVIYPSNIAEYENVSIKTAYKRIKKIKKAMGLDPKKHLTIFNYAKYYNFDVLELERFINHKNTNKTKE